MNREDQRAIACDSHVQIYEPVVHRDKIQGALLDRRVCASQQLRRFGLADRGQQRR